ncbi:hypothetical protein PNOK_0872400 [Pyrrhoderma noxium]|uniref:Uncharacterized protein n=1 Tax=Pyrrhoderma noxium TaxID=2282107 RepID=A0A286U8H7_9AGAM|nr:hypothetical protein PNOK_0872400 [Pyrrhoderma noxium]
MQNAQRVKEQATIELERAKVKDEAEWEVPKEVREAWGLAPKAQSKQTIEQETSYLPFLFPSLQKGVNVSTSSDDISSSLKPSGRRTFNKGKEVSTFTSTSATSADAVKAVKPESNIKTSHITGQGVDCSGDIREESNSDITASVAAANEGRSTVPSYRRGAGPGPLSMAKASKMAKLDKDGLRPPGRRDLPGVPVLSMINAESADLVGVDMRTARKLKVSEQSQERSISTAKPASSFSAASNLKQDNAAAANLGSGSLTFQRPAGIDSPVSVPNKKSKKRPRDVLDDNNGLGSNNEAMKEGTSTHSKNLSSLQSSSDLANSVEDVDSRRRVKKKKKQGKFTAETTS